MENIGLRVKHWNIFQFWMFRAVIRPSLIKVAEKIPVASCWK